MNGYAIKIPDTPETRSRVPTTTPLLQPATPISLLTLQPFTPTLFDLDETKLEIETEDDTEEQKERSKKYEELCEKINNIPVNMSGENLCKYLMCKVQIQDMWIKAPHCNGCCGYKVRRAYATTGDKIKDLYNMYFYYDCDECEEGCPNTERLRAKKAFVEEYNK